MPDTYVAFTQFVVARPNQEDGGFNLCDPDTGIIRAWIPEYPSHWPADHMLRLHLGLFRELAGQDGR